MDSGHYHNHPIPRQWRNWVFLFFFFFFFFFGGGGQRRGGARRGGQGGGGGQTFVWGGGGLEEGIAMIFFPSHLLCTIKSQMADGGRQEGTHGVCEREMFYLTTQSTHFIYGYMASDIWLRTILIVRKETRCRHIGYSYRLTPRVLLHAPSHRQDNTYQGLCYTSRGALAGTRNSSMGPPHGVTATGPRNRIPCDVISFPNTNGHFR